MRRSLRIAFIPAVLIAVTISVTALPPTTMKYQGYVELTNGVPYNGSLDVSFSLCSEATGDNDLWNSTTQSVTISEGYYSVDIGDADFVEALLSSGKWVEVSFDGVPMTPRKELQSSPYAMTGRRLDLASVVTIDTATQRIGVGTNNPSAALDVVGSVRISGGDPDVDDVLVSDADGVASWSDPGSTVAAGSIVLWYGGLGSIPAGWALCDGTSGTPDLQDRFVVGAGGSYSPGDTGGQATHSHSVSVSATTSSAGNHSHSVDFPNITSSSAGNHSHSMGSLRFSRSFSTSEGSGGGAYRAYTSGGGSGHFFDPKWEGGSTAGAGSHTHTANPGAATSSSTGAHTHSITMSTTSSSSNNEPPYMVLCYIMKL